jgi:hypothetical protein
MEGRLPPQRIVLSLIDERYLLYLFFGCCIHEGDKKCFYQAIRVFGAIRPLLGGSLILLRSISSMNLKKQT